MDPTTAFIVAGIGFLGVLIGGLITGTTNYLLAVGKERADQAKERRINAVELQTAARLILAENSLYYVQIVLVIENPDRPLPTERKMEAWEKYRPVLAANLKYSEWAGVSDSIYVWTARETSPLASLSKVDYAKRAREALEKAMGALQAYSATSEPGLWDTTMSQSASPSSEKAK